MEENALIALIALIALAAIGLIGIGCQWLVTEPELSTYFGRQLFDDTVTYASLAPDRPGRRDSHHTIK